MTIRSRRVLGTREATPALLQRRNMPFLPATSKYGAYWRGFGDGMKAFADWFYCHCFFLLLQSAIVHYLLPA